MINKNEFKRRRKHLLEMAGSDAIVMLSAAPDRIRNNDVHYPYRQDSDFYYLSGFNEPDAVMLLIPSKDGNQSIMFCRERDLTRETWDGPMIGLEGATGQFGMDQAYSIKELDMRMPGYLENCDKVVYNLGKDSDLDQKVMAWFKEIRSKKGAHAPEELIAVDHELHEMRLYKSKGELALMRKSAEIGCEAHIRAMQICRPGLNEADLHAEILNVLTRNLCETSYLPIVAAGSNACILHYIANNQPINDGDLVLIDAGAELDGYASDITRTFPANGKFSAEQKALYEIVLAANEAAIDISVPGKQHIDSHNEAVRVITEGLIDVGLLEGSVEDRIEDESFGDFYIHKTGHWLGLDVHDVGEYMVDGHSRALEPGMVMTIEPGIYIRPDNTSVDERWRGIGIRIEDDIAIAGDKPEVLSAAVPKTVTEIESIMTG
jgi:Xaa-Pro aminopeptidase